MTQQLAEQGLDSEDSEWNKNPEHSEQKPEEHDD